jgi:nucleotide-binding universal stress UspA family protein
MMKILLAVDGSDASMSAVAAVEAMSLPTGSAIEVVSVVPLTFAPDGSVWPNVIRVDPPSDRERVLGDVAERLNAIAGRLRTAGTSVDTRVLEGRPATEIVIEADRSDADLIVMGARGLSAVRRLLLGSVSSEVVDHAPCPVFVARHAAVERVMFATDGSPGAADAAEFITDSGLFDRSRFRVVSAADPGMPWWVGISPVDGSTSMELFADAVAIAEHRAQKAADQAADMLSSLEVEDASAVKEGDVVASLLAQAEAWPADVIVLGARHLGTVHRWLVGSVSRSILHLARASVLIVRPRAAGSPEREEAAATTA